MGAPAPVSDSEDNKGGHHSAGNEVETETDIEIELAEVVNVNYKVGDKVVYPHHGAGKVLKKEQKEVLGEVREYLTIKILHNDMTVMVPCESARPGRAAARDRRGRRRAGAGGAARRHERRCRRTGTAASSTTGTR